MRARTFAIEAALILLGAGSTACEPSTPPDVAPSPTALPTSPAATPATPVDASGAQPATGLNDVRGGQLYDKWWALEPYEATFAPARDGKGRGGPNGDGTLNDEGGKPLANDGHDYRLKSFFGWDLRGAEGIYGPAHQNKPYVLKENLLTQTAWDRAALVERLRRGGDGLPAYGAVLSDDDLENLAFFILKVRDGELAKPDQIFELDGKAPKGYRLRAGGDAERGRAFFADACARCHGDDGQKKLFEDGKHSLGSHARTAAYEDWFKVLSGQPGTEMGRQLPGRHSGADQARIMLDLFAALCDATAFPPVAPAEDAPAGDPRCGPYLKR